MAAHAVRPRVPRRGALPSRARGRDGRLGRRLSDATPPTRAAIAYDAAADTYDAPALAFWDRYGRRTIERAAPPRGARVLDVCCGGGASALVAAELVGPEGRVLGVDLAERLLALARAKAVRQGASNVEFRVGDLERLDDVGGGFDLVVCVFGIFFASDMTAALGRLWERVAPGGTLAVTTWGPRVFAPGDPAFWDAIRAEAPALHKTFNPWDRIAEPDALRALFSTAGIADVHVEAEAGTQPLATPDDWWTIVMGSGYRGTVDRLDGDARERVRAHTLAPLRSAGTSALETNVLYAIVRRPPPG